MDGFQKAKKYQNSVSRSVRVGSVQLSSAGSEKSHPAHHPLRGASEKPNFTTRLRLGMLCRPDQENTAIAGASDSPKTLDKFDQLLSDSLCFCCSGSSCVLDPAYGEELVMKGKTIGKDPQAIELDNRDVFVRLLMRSDRTIRAYLRSLLPTLEDVDEVMQEVSVVAWRKFDQLDDPENFRRWVCVIARYEVLMYRRKKARDRVVLENEIVNLIADEGLEELELREHQLSALEVCMEKLPAQKKQLVLRVYGEKQPVSLIASQMGKTPDAIYKMTSRVRHSLFECVRRSLAGESS